MCSKRDSIPLLPCVPTWVPPGKRPNAAKKSNLTTRCRQRLSQLALPNLCVVVAVFRDHYDKLRSKQRQTLTNIINRIEVNSKSKCNQNLIGQAKTMVAAKCVLSEKSLMSGEPLTIGNSLSGGKYLTTRKTSTTRKLNQDGDHYVPKKTKTGESLKNGTISKKCTGNTCNKDERNHEHKFFFKDRSICENRGKHCNKKIKIGRKAKNNFKTINNGLQIYDENILKYKYLFRIIRKISSSYENSSYLGCLMLNFEDSYFIGSILKSFPDQPSYIHVLLEPIFETERSNLIFVKEEENNYLVSTIAKRKFKLDVLKYLIEQI